MAAKKKTVMTAAEADPGGTHTSASVDDMLLAALNRGDDTLQTGRFLATFKEGAADAGAKSFAAAQGMRVADARDFTDQAISLENVAGADAVMFPEIGVALVSGPAAAERGMSAAAEIASDSAVASIDPEYFVFTTAAIDEYFRTFAADGGISNPGEYLRGFLRAAETIAKDLGSSPGTPVAAEHEEQALVLGATWGLSACRIPPSTRSGNGIKVAVLDTGMDLGHPDFVGRIITSASFVGQPVQDLHNHGTHCIGTSCGPQAPSGSTPRYGTAYRAQIFAGKVLTNAGNGATAGILAGINWAIANRCEVISMSLGSPSGVQPAYTAAGQAALNNGLLIVAAAGNTGLQTGAPANSPTIMSVAALKQNLTTAIFSCFGKIEISGPGVDIFSSFPRPARYGFMSGTSQATPHVAGCAALWAETSPNLRGVALRQKLMQTAKPLSQPATRVGAGLVQAP
jgi:subtilisin family serine protease